MANAAPTGAELDALAKEAETARAHSHGEGRHRLPLLSARSEAAQRRVHQARARRLLRRADVPSRRARLRDPGRLPAGNRNGRPGYNLDAEFNDLPHVKGTVAMARSSNPNSAGSQFYICLGDARFLDKQYTVFGQTVEGQDVVDSIRVGDVMETVTIEETPA
jgi:hypothetical protein